MYSIEKVIREGKGCDFVYDFHLKNDFNVTVGVFHSMSLACEVRDLLNKSDDKDRIIDKLREQRDCVYGDLTALKKDYLELSRENEQLKKENENWKSSACSNASFNSILLNELSIAQEQGYEVSDPFKKLMENKND